MEDILKQFEKDLRAHLESTFIASDEQNEIKKLDEIEKKANEYVDCYILETGLIAGDVALSVQHVMDDFIKSKI
jgi:hypothetical protein